MIRDEERYFPACRKPAGKHLTALHADFLALAISYQLLLTVNSELGTGNFSRYSESLQYRKAHAIIPMGS